ncbi:MAG TPA: cellulase family glycosylhydrolase [Streptosporangiaceae bacterium]|nr:cellulase family glycosylhydrolase [Streptosporangiaceae bacterium]
MRFRTRRARYLAIAAAAGLAASAAVAAVSSASTAAATCQVQYTVQSEWSTGFSLAVAITNEGSPISGWTLGYSYTGNQRLTDGWDGTWTQSGENVTVTSASWNGSLGTGGAASAGANFSDSGTNAAPTTFTLNGTACSTSAGPVASPAPTPTQSAAPTPPPSPSPTATAAPSPTASASPSPTAPATSAAPQLHVSGNELVNAAGTRVVLHGVDRSGTEYSCVQGNGIFDGPSDQASITAMKSWGVNAVRVPLNEACWNGESYVNPAFAGANYQDAIEAYVNLLNANGMVAILDLHWSDGQYTGSSSACSSAQAVCQKPMPDAAESVPFWTSVAKAFKGNDAVIFDLFNEPYPEQADGGNETEGWQCWLNGGSDCVGISYAVAGMQTLVNAVRSTGASNVIMLGGLAWANDLTQWLAYEPTDPDHSLVASWHSYNFNACNNQTCWTSEVAPVIAKVPVIAGEIGENDCAGSYIDPLMTWLDSEGTSYLAWAWNADFNCSSGPGLITNYDGAATAFGAGYESHLQALAGG